MSSPRIRKGCNLAAATLLSLPLAPKAQGVDIALSLRPGTDAQMCLDIKNSSWNNGEQLSIERCNNAQSQLWHLVKGHYKNQFSLRSAMTGKCIDVYSESQDQGGKLVQWPCNDKNNQLFNVEWKSDGWHTIRGVQSGLCMDVPSSSTTPGTTIWQWGCNNTKAQLWFPYPHN